MVAEDRCAVDRHQTSHPMRTLTAISILVLLFAGCTALPSVQPLSVDPGETRARMLDLAIGEWRAFGGQVVRFSGKSERIDPVGIWEDTAQGSALVARYWRAIDLGWNGADCDKPWSAAFLSWLIAEAGVRETEFTGGALHSEYLRAIAAGRGEAGRRFQLRDPALYAPKPGDLICAPREGPAAKSFDRIEPEAPMHCDIVIANEDGFLDSIGGNVRNSVSRTLRPVAPGGLVTSAPDRPWQLVVENLYP
jgi:Uncharacterized protein conserved in bacteria (DUF2272)